MRPGQELLFTQCKGVRIEDVTIRNMCCWTCVFYGSEHVRVGRVKVRNGFRHLNTDAFDIDCCHDVKIGDCDIVTGDDAFAIRGDPTHFRGPSRACTDIEISNSVCRVQAATVRIGVGSGEIDGVRISGLDISDCGYGLLVQSSYGDKSKGVTISNVEVSDFDIGMSGQAVKITGGRESSRAAIRNVSVRNMKAKTLLAPLVAGMGTTIPDGISFQDCEFTVVGKDGGDSVQIDNCGKVELKNVKVTAKPGPYGFVYASDYGFDPEDSTSALQRALDSGVARVIVDRQAGPWVTKPLKINRSDVELILKDGVDIVAKRGEFKSIGARLLTVVAGISNVTVRGVGTARLVMHKRDYQNPELGYKHSEWRHALAVFAASNVSVSNLHLVASGGDGVYLFGSKDVLLQDLRCLDNHRQGMSPICVDGLTVRRCVFNDTIGTPPQSGMDLEPNKPSQYLKRVLFEDCVFNGNKAHGIDLYFGHLDATSEPVSITFRRCTARGNGFSGITFITGTVKRIYASGQVKGTVLFEDCVSAANGQYAFKLGNHTPDGMKIRFRNCVFDARGASSDSAILITNAHLAENTGVVSFENSKVILDKGMKAVCIENQRGFGLVPGYSGTLDVVRDGKTETLDLAKMARKHAPNPDIAIRFRPRAVDFRKLEVAAPTEPLKGLRTPEMLTRFVYVVAAPQAGEYDIKFKSRLRKKDKTGPCATVQLLDGIGTDLGSFDIPAGDFTYRLKADGKKIYRLEVSLKNTGVVRVLNSSTAGGILFSSQLRIFNGKNQTFHFHVPEGAKEVFADIAPGKGPASAQLIDPSGKIADELPLQKIGRVLRNNPKESVPSGTWTLKFPDVNETVYLQMGGDALPVLSTERAAVIRPSR